MAASDLTWFPLDKPGTFKYLWNYGKLKSSQFSISLFWQFYTYLLFNQKKTIELYFLKLTILICCKTHHKIFQKIPIVFCEFCKSKFCFFKVKSFWKMNYKLNFFQVIGNSRNWSLYITFFFFFFFC